MILSRQTLTELRAQGYVEVNAPHLDPVNRDPVAAFKHVCAPLVIPHCADPGVYCVRGWIAFLVLNWPIPDDFNRDLLRCVIAIGMRHGEPEEFAKVVEATARLGGAAGVRALIGQRLEHEVYQEQGT